MEPTFCTWAQGVCPYNNTPTCPKMPVLTHCNALREANRKAKEGK